MSEYIVDWDENLVIDTFSKNSLREEIVRCRDCEYRYDNQCGRNLDWFDIEFDGFCKWGERK